jgi:TonB family protein
VKVNRIFVVAVLALSLTSIGFSQSIASSTNDHRKVVKRIAPAYPELAKRMGVSGAVKLELTVAPSGKVTDVRILGGHPVLASSAQQSAHGWMFEPGAESTEQVTVNFTM